jgi:hypothetical protein
MSSDNFTQKEILLQVMKELRELRSDVADQKILLQTHINASAERDLKIAELSRKMDRVESEIEEMKGFKAKVLTVWAIGIFLATFLANKII